MNLYLALQFNPAEISFSLIMPEVIVCLAGVVVMMVDAFARHTQRWLTGGISLIGLAAAAISSILLWVSGSGVATAFNGMIVLDGLRLGFTIVFLIVSSLTVLIS